MTRTLHVLYVDLSLMFVVPAAFMGACVWVVVGDVAEPSGNQAKWRSRLLRTMVDTYEVDHRITRES